MDGSTNWHSGASIATSHLKHSIKLMYRSIDYRTQFTSSLYRILNLLKKINLYSKFRNRIQTRIGGVCSTSRKFYQLSEIKRGKLNLLSVCSIFLFAAMRVTSFHRSELNSVEFRKTLPKLEEEHE